MPEHHDRPARVRVALVEDDDILRAELSERVAASATFEVVGAASTLQEARELVAFAPQVFLIDLALPDGSGLELITELATAAPECKALVISVFGDVRNVVRAIELGAAGYLLKGTEAAQVAAAIETVLRGGAPLSPAVAGHILNRVRKDAAVANARPVAKLTPREIDLLESLARGLTVKEVAAVHGISPHTVGDHVKAIYKKLAVSSRGEAIFEAAQSGLIRLHD
ncbi:MAG: response regulator transcription factor [Myxococcus sp.]|nr:response regulator transcription factor [Myxococcus sp.]